MTKTVGLVGLGLIGNAMASRLLAAGFDVVGFDIDAGRRNGLAALGGRPVESIHEVARLASRIILAVLTIDQVEDVVEGKAGLFEAPAIADGQRVVLCAATCTPSRITALSARAARRGVILLDTPVSATSVQVRNGDGLGLVAGDRPAVDAATDVLDAIYPKRRYVGSAGDASKTKLAINLILGLNRLALAEGLVFAQTLDLDLKSFFEVARQSAAYSFIMDLKGQKMVDGDFTPHGAIATSLKDAKIMLAEAAQRGQQLPLGTVYVGVMEDNVRAGEGQLDNSAVIREVRRRIAR